MITVAAMVQLLIETNSEIMVQKLLERSPLTKYMVELEESNHWYGKAVFSTAKKEFGSAERLCVY